MYPPSGAFNSAISESSSTRPARAKAVFNYPIVWAAGDVDLGGDWPKVLEEYVRKGGTLVVNITAAKGLPASLLGFEKTKDFFAENVGGLFKKPAKPATTTGLAGAVAAP